MFHNCAILVGHLKRLFSEDTCVLRQRVLRFAAGRLCVLRRAVRHRGRLRPGLHKNATFFIINILLAEYFLVLHHLSVLSTNNVCLKYNSFIIGVKFEENP